MKKICLAIILSKLFLGCSVATVVGDAVGGVLLGVPQFAGDVLGEAVKSMTGGTTDVEESSESYSAEPEYGTIENTETIAPSTDYVSLENNPLENDSTNIEENIAGEKNNKAYYENGQLKFESIKNGNFITTRSYREDGTLIGESNYDQVSKTREQKIYNEQGELTMHNFFDGNLNAISEEEYNRLQSKNTGTAPSQSSEGMDEEVQRYLNDPSSPIVSREKLIKYLNNLDGARVETDYHPNGMLSDKDYYKDGKFELYKNYDENGKLIKILVYDIEAGAQYE